MTPTLLAALEATIERATTEAPANARLIAIGWSTVDTDRAARAFGVEAPTGDDGVGGVDEALGARCRLLDLGRQVPLVLVEPSTEGRLSASLARLGEGPVVRWYAVDRAAPGSAGGRGHATAGPFGPETLLERHAREGPFTFLVAGGTGTITT